jgi:uroporphyrinogen-III synthase
MQENKLNILSTRPLSNEIINEAAQQNASIDCISFIETKAIQNIGLEERLHNFYEENITAVFTSMNAVEAVKEYLPEKPKWNIFSIGQTTKEVIADFFGEEHIIATANDASALADTIIEKKIKEVVFFCGDQRRDELPEKLKAKNIAVEEVVVYATIATFEKLSKRYDGILFFSPSAVESFFSLNEIDSNTILFAIGNTTAEAISQKVKNKIIIAERPGKEALVKEMLKYFSTQKQVN